MSNESTRCQFIDKVTHMECEKWYPFDPEQKYCEHHRQMADQDITARPPHIPRTVHVMNGAYLSDLNAKVLACQEMTIPELEEHIKSIEDQVRSLERDKRAAMMAKKCLEDRMTEEERTALREKSGAYAIRPRLDSGRISRKRDPEEKASNRKSTWAQWAARFGVTTEKLMLMDDDEREAKVAKYKAQHKPQETEE